MTEIRLTKNELRAQEYKRNQLEKYLPTLQLKKMLLQLEINHVNAHIQDLKQAFKEQREEIETFLFLLSDTRLTEFFYALRVEDVETSSENIAGTEVPVFEKIRFDDTGYDLFDTPFWWESAIEKLRKLIKLEKQLEVAFKRKQLLEEELRTVSIRVNLFEKILIPRTAANIKKIKVFLGDQQLAAVSQAKMAKLKILKRKK